MAAVLTTIRVEMVKTPTICKSHSNETPSKPSKHFEGWFASAKPQVDKVSKVRVVDRAGLTKAERALERAKIFE